MSAEAQGMSTLVFNCQSQECSSICRKSIHSNTLRQRSIFFPQAAHSGTIVALDSTRVDHPNGGEMLVATAHGCLALRAIS
jgi:hypothetical protein